MSSMIESVTKKIFRLAGTLLLKIIMIPRANAVSVAIGIAQPFSAKASAWLNA